MVLLKKGISDTGSPVVETLSFKAPIFSLNPRTPTTSCETTPHSQLRDQTSHLHSTITFSGSNNPSSISELPVSMFEYCQKIDCSICGRFLAVFHQKMAVKLFMPIQEINNNCFISSILLNKQTSRKFHFCLLAIINLCLCRNEFKIILDELDWMDDITRKEAHAKVDKMQVIIGYAKEILDPKLLNQFYEGNEEFISWNKIHFFIFFFKY